jgi:hypothetical protein
MILIDYNAVAISTFLASKVLPTEDSMRHMILNQIRIYRIKFQREYGEICIVADNGTNNFRREIFPQYKAKRKKTRNESKVDWNEVYRCTDLVRDDIRDNFPYKVIHQEGCEADDAIAQLCYETQEFGKHEPVMIISGDKDFLQLQTMKNVKQYSTVTKKFLVEPNPRLFLADHILKGDSSDGVPNVLSDDNVFVDERRQNTLTAKKKAMLMEDPSALGDEVLRNIHRNRKLIDLKECPEVVKQDIINNYDSQDPYHNRGKVFPYLIQKRCRLLIESVGEFI